ncbi:MAG TPA: hypothetical protein P5127_04735, partial [Oscillospiraceae bacterium]|nr:hypothetical protein [Oscillospiraceae bacterium]
MVFDIFLLPFSFFDNFDLTLSICFEKYWLIFLDLFFNIITSPLLSTPVPKFFKPKSIDKTFVLTSFSSK